MSADTIADDNQSPEQIERDIEHTRARMDDTIDAIQEKFSPGQVADQVWRYVREGGANDFVANLGRTVRDNPIPTALIGVGLAWMMISGTSRKSRSDRTGARTFTTEGTYDPYYGEPETGAGARAFAAGYGPVADYPEESSGYYRDAEHLHHGPDSTDYGDAGDAGPGLGSRAASAASSAGGAVSDAASSARDAVGSAAASVKEAALGAVRRVGEGTGQAAQTAKSAGRAVRGAAEDAGRQIGQVGHWAREAGRSVGDTAGWAGDGLNHLLTDRPLVVGALGVAVGAVIGALLPSTRREDELMGETRNSLLDQAQIAARDTAGKAMSAVTAAAEAVVHEAEAQGLTRSHGEEELRAAVGSVSEKAERVVKAAVHAAREEVRSSDAAPEAGEPARDEVRTPTSAPA